MRVRVLFSVFVLSLVLSGCLYRGDGAFKKIGDSDFKARLNLLNLFVAADGYPTHVKGMVLLEDLITPLKYTDITLRSKYESKVVAKGQTDHLGHFDMTGILKNDEYVLEVSSPNYRGTKEVTIEANKDNWRPLVAQKR